MGLFDILLTLKGKIKFFLPIPSLQCCVALFELPVENSKHPNFEWRGGGGVWIPSPKQKFKSKIRSLLFDILETGDTYYDLDEIIFEMKKRTF